MKPFKGLGLRRILSDTIQTTNNMGIAVLFTIAPSIDNKKQTSHTLRFAELASLIKAKPVTKQPETQNKNDGVTSFCFVCVCCLGMFYVFVFACLLFLCVRQQTLQINSQQKGMLSLSVETKPNMKDDTLGENLLTNNQIQTKQENNEEKQKDYQPINEKEINEKMIYFEEKASFPFLPSFLCLFLAL